jgi:hypothetical protein
VRHLVHFLLQIRLLFFRYSHAASNLRGMKTQARGRDFAALKAR